jgi:two-component system response regulator AtoC
MLATREEQSTLVLCRPRRQGVWLRAIWEGGSAGLLIGLRGVVTVGRSAEVALRVEHGSVSRQHARVERDDAGIWIVDCGSANGTRLNGVPLGTGERGHVRRGTLVEVGDAVLVLECEDGSLLDSPPGTAPPRAVSTAALNRLVSRLAVGRMPVVILGETGVGKRRFAEAIHLQSNRATGPFLQVNCSGLAADQLEVELFGIEADAMPGSGRRRGLIEAATGGTALLDEVGALSAELQAKLLGVLESGTVVRIGGSRALPFDSRLIATSNRDLPVLVDAGDFRPDLYHRLCGAVLEVPPLRRRIEEIPELASQILQELATTQGRRAPVVAGGTLEVLQLHSWPGNVRELRHALELALLMCDGASLEPQHLPPSMAPSVSGLHSLRREMDDLERERITRALDQFDGNQTRAASALGMPRRTLIAKLERYGLPRPRKGQREP